MFPVYFVKRDTSSPPCQIHLVWSGDSGKVTPPITLNGSDPVIVAVGSVYTDAGATALDAIDGVRPVATSGSVNTSVIGTYTITYTATDLAGNSATMTRTVNVADQTAPTATVSYSTTAPTNGNVVATITPSEPVTVTNNGGLTTRTFTANGIFTFTFVDAASNTGSATAAVSNIDTVAPVITIAPHVTTPTNQDITVTASTNEGTLNAATYTFTTNGSFSFVATDTAGNVSTATVTISNINKVAPVITILGNNPETVTQGSVYTDAGATALDDTDGAITPVTTGSVDTSIVGSCTITYTATDAAGNTATANRLVNATAAPVTTFDITATAGANGTINPSGTTTVSQGADQTYTITANAGYDIATLVVDGVSIATSTSYTFTNVQAAHTIDATFVAQGVDAIAPSSVAITSSSHATSNISSNLTVTMSWSDASDTGGSGLAGYSYVFDTASSTIPDIVVEGATPTTSQILAYGTYYFHVHAVDVAGNSGAATHYGPILISDSNVLILNSTIGGTYYNAYSPTLVQAALASTTGATIITSSTVSNWWEISSSTLSGVTFDNAIVSGVTATNSTIINSDLTNCTIINSLVKNYFGSGCSISDSIVDPPSGMNNLTGSTVSGNSKIYASNVTYSTVVDSYIATSTISYSTLTSATSTISLIDNSTLTNTAVASTTMSYGTVSNSSVADSTVLNTTVASSTVTANSYINGGNISGSTLISATSTNSIVIGGSLTLSTLINATSTYSILNGTTLIGGSVASSTISNTTLTNSIVTNSSITNATISGSTLDAVNVLGTATTIVNSDLSNTTVTNATIANGVMESGTIFLPDGTPVTISTSTPLTDLVNYAPVASFTVTVSDLGITLTDTTTDTNSGGTLGDGWAYVWDFGNGMTATTTSATLWNGQTFTYGAAGTYTVTVTITDAFGKTSALSVPVTVTAPVITPPTPPVTGGGGGGAVILGYTGPMASGGTTTIATTTATTVNTSGAATSTGITEMSSAAATSSTSSKKAVMQAKSTGTSSLATTTKQGNVAAGGSKMLEEKGTQGEDQTASVLSSISEENSWFTRIKEFFKRAYRKVRSLW